MNDRVSLSNLPRRWSVDIIGIGDKKGVGKNVFAKFLQEGLLQIKPEALVYQLAFADGVKKAVSAKFGCHLALLNDEHFKKQVNEKTGLTWRRHLQLEGTEFGRESYYDNIWVDRVETTIDSILRNISTNSYSHNVDLRFFFLITDCRFDNEADWIRRNGGKVVRVVRPHLDDSEDGDHASERGVKECDIEVINNSTLEYLQVEANDTAQIILDH